VNMLKKGPELKVPDFKVPDFMLDIYYDLRERHLLPLVAILLVALVALPIALTRGSSESEPTESGAVATPSSAVPSSNLVVAKATPGLRDYRRRLDDRSPQDPFVQQYTGAETEGGVGSIEGGAASSSSSESSSVTVESTSTESTGIELPAEGGEEPSETGRTYYSFVIDVRVVPGSGFGPNKPEPAVRRDLPELTMLPSRKTPALTFMTVSKDEKKVLMLVNDNVRGLFGDGVCVVGTDTCQLIALEPGIPETVVYGADERVYRIEILKLHFVTTDSLDKAPLGKQKQGGKPENAG
jgi:hypothetical protein